MAIEQGPSSRSDYFSRQVGEERALSEYRKDRTPLFRGRFSRTQFFHIQKGKVKVTSLFPSKGKGSSCCNPGAGSVLRRRLAVARRASAHGDSDDNDRV